jgi:hypothetical protein
MNRIVATILMAAVLGLPIPLAQARGDPQWLKCTLNQDIVRDSAGKVTTKALSGSVIFVIDDVTQNFFTYSEATKAFTKLQADVKDREVTFYDGPLFDTIGRVTGTFSVVASPFHEAHGNCVPITPLVTGSPKF